MDAINHFSGRRKERIAGNLRKALITRFPDPGPGKRLAEAMEVSPATVSRWLNGKKCPNLEQLNRLAKTLDVPLHRLLGYSDNFPKRNGNPLLDSVVRLSIMAERLRRGDDSRPKETRRLVKRLEKTVAKAKTFMSNSE